MAKPYKERGKREEREHVVEMTGSREPILYMILSMSILASLLYIRGSASNDAASSNSLFRLSKRSH
jgi:hypothetical protein